MPDAVLPALWCVLEVWEVSDYPGVYLLNWESPGWGGFYRHEDEAGEGVGRLGVGVHGGRGGGSFTGGAGRGGDSRRRRRSYRWLCLEYYLIIYFISHSQLQHDLRINKLSHWLTLTCRENKLNFK